MPIAVSSSRGDVGKLTQTIGAYPIWKTRPASSARAGMVPLSTTISSAFASGSSRTSQRPAPRLATNAMQQASAKTLTVAIRTLRRNVIRIG
jgi:hypothetical protein